MKTKDMKLPLHTCWMLVALETVLAAGGCGAIGSQAGKRWSMPEWPWLNNSNEVPKLATAAEVPDWEWSPMLTHQGTRAELLSVEVSESAMAHFLPDLQGDIRLVAGFPQGARITHVGGTSIESYSDLLEAVQSKVAGPVQVDFRLQGINSSVSEHALIVSEDRLESMLRTMNDKHPVVRYTEAQNNWVYLRSGRVACKLMARREQRTGLVHLVLAVKNCWGPTVVLPAEVQVFGSQGEPLRCLKVAEILEVLYGDATRLGPPQSGTSYTQIAEQDDYNLPTNYKRLVEESESEEPGAASPLYKSPAFLSLEEESYPGPALLGDARMLSGLLLRPQLHQAHEPEQMGWIVFQGQPNAAGELMVRIHFEAGPIDIRMTPPGA